MKEPSPKSPKYKHGLRRTTMDSFSKINLKSLSDTDSVTSVGNDPEVSLNDFKKCTTELLRRTNYIRSPSVNVKGPH